MSKTWLQDNLNHLWHPYTQMKDLETEPPLLIKRAKGALLYDEDDRPIIDAIASWWSVIHGHSHPSLLKALHDQAEKMQHIVFAGLTHEPAINLAKSLSKRSPEPLSRVFFSDNGSTANEVAMKMSLQYWQHSGSPEKNRFIGIENGYHGDTIGAMSVGGVPLFHHTFSPLMFPAKKLPSPDSREAEAQSLQALEALLKAEHQCTAALIMEPLVMGAGGFIMTSRNYVQECRRLTRQYNVHLIFDEVAVGFGRTGKFFASDTCQLSPDFLTLSKGLTSGTMPLSATLTSEEVYRVFFDEYPKHKTFYHGHTFTANPMACAVANASLALFEEEQTLETLQPKIQSLSRIATELSQNPAVHNCRQTGFILAWDIIDPNTGKPFPEQERIPYKLYLETLKNGVMMRPLGNTMYLFPPLCITEQQLQRCSDAYTKALNRVLHLNHGH